MKKIIIDKETLYQLYVVEQKSLTEISEILNLNRRTVTINIEDYGFKDSIKHNKRRRVDKTNNLEELKKQFYQDYICNDMTLEQLISKYGYTRYKTKQLLKEFGIVKQKNKTSDKRIYDDKELLYDLYVTQKKSIQLISAELNCSEETISRKLKIFGIQSRKNHVSKSNRNKSYSNYKMLLKKSRKKFNNELRVKRLKIDGFKCQCCGGTTKLEVHHIKTLQSMVDNTLQYFNIKDLSNIDIIRLIANIVQERYDYNDLGNLITVCKDCHIKIHTNKLPLNIKGQTTIPEGSTLEDWLPTEVLDNFLNQIEKLKI